jgi:predicted RNA-binding protein
VNAERMIGDRVRGFDIMDRDHQFAGRVSSTEGSGKSSR